MFTFAFLVAQKNDLENFAKGFQVVPDALTDVMH